MPQLSAREAWIVDAALAGVGWDWACSPMYIQSEAARPSAGGAVVVLDANLQDVLGGNPLPGGKSGGRGGSGREPWQDNTQSEAAAVEVPAGWCRGQPGGVAVVLAGEAPPEGVALKLFVNMLAALGLGEAPVWWVGAAGADVAGRVRQGQPQKVLLLGQAAVQAVWPTMAGVEAWARAPEPWPGVGAVALGVSYAPQLLLQQPLFKGLAWRHLCAWRAQWAG